MTIAEMRALLMKATPGPWEAPTQPESMVNVWSPTKNIAHEVSGPDAELIVAAVNALPYLLDVAEETLKYLKDGGHWHEQRIKIAEAIARVSERT